MQPSNSLPSLKQLCLQAVVDNCKQNEVAIQQDVTIKTRVAPEIFQLLNNLSSDCVSLKVYSWTNHQFCLYTEESYHLHECFSSLADKIRRRTGFIIKSFKVDDHEWNTKYTSSMWQTIENFNQGLINYSYKAAEEVTIFAEISHKS